MNPEQEKEFQVRANLFKEEFEPLLKKYELELTAFPLYAAAPGGAFVTVINQQIADTKYKGVPSPINEDDLWEK
jgi:hypothetical protein